MLHQRRPYLPKERPVVRYRTRRIPADERIHDANSESRARADYLFQMLDHRAAMFRIGIQWIGVIAESGNGDAVLLDERTNLLGPVIIEPGDIEVANAGVAAIGVARRPAHYFDAAKAFRGGKFENVGQG